MRYHLILSCELTLIFLACQLPVFSEEFSGISLPENTAIVLAVTAEGVQIYESKQKPGGGFQWTLKAPDAQLKSAAGEVLGKHGAGPSWTLNDGSSIVGVLSPFDLHPKFNSLLRRKRRCCTGCAVLKPNGVWWNAPESFFWPPMV